MPFSRAWRHPADPGGSNANAIFHGRFARAHDFGRSMLACSGSDVQVHLGNPQNANPRHPRWSLALLTNTQGNCCRIGRYVCLTTFSSFCSLAGFVMFVMAGIGWNWQESTFSCGTSQVTEHYLMCADICWHFLPCGSIFLLMLFREIWQSEGRSFGGGSMAICPEVTRTW